MRNVADTADVQGTRILVGESAATLKLGLRNADFQSQEYMIGVCDEDLVLMGHDAAEPFLFFRGAPTPCEGRFGKARAFDGAHNYIASQPIGLDNAQGSMEVWVRPADGWEGWGQWCASTTEPQAPGPSRDCPATKAACRMT